MLPSNGVHVLTYFIPLHCNRSVCVSFHISAQRGHPDKHYFITSVSGYHAILLHINTPSGSRKRQAD